MKRRGYRLDGPPPEDGGEDLPSVLSDIEATLGDLDRLLNMGADPALASSPPVAEPGAKETAAAPTASSVALERIADALSDFCLRTNAEAPRIQRLFRLDPQAAYADLAWRGAIVDRRPRPPAPAGQVVFRVRLAAAEGPAVSRRRDQLPAFRLEAEKAGLRILRELPDARPEYVTLLLAPEFPVQLVWRTDPDRGRIEVQATNLERLSPALYAVEPEQVDGAFLDQLGRYLLGRANNLPRTLARLH